jgi:hypothetical protein
MWEGFFGRLGGCRASGGESECNGNDEMRGLTLRWWMRLNAVAKFCEQGRAWVCR